MRRVAPIFTVVLLCLALAVPAAQTVTLGRPDSLKFAVIGDNGNGAREQYEVGAQMAASRDRFPFEFVLMMGDNIYGRQRPDDLVMRFERPYQKLLNAGVKFYAAIGNHDDPDVDRNYAPFNMNGARYYTYAKKNVRFVAADTNFFEPAQRSWLERTLQQAREEWKIVYFHHPLYSDGDRHGSNVELRLRIEPLLVAYGVDVVLSGHDHIYERIKPQHGITYFVAGSGGQLRPGGIAPSNITAAGFADDQAFMLMEVAGPELAFQAISRTGRIVDSGIIHGRRTS
jgi:3',5'-cyclic AMP phosphodiesterase CpdA